MTVHEQVEAALRARSGPQAVDYRLPPPVFAAMGGEFLELDLEAGRLRTRFPVRTDQLNPYGTMQGGMVAAIIDNTIGPLSMLVGPLNVTRRLEIVFSRGATPAGAPLSVCAELEERRKRQLFFRAVVHDRNGTQIARARAVHWITAPD